MKPNGPTNRKSWCAKESMASVSPASSASTQRLPNSPISATSLLIPPSFLRVVLHPQCNRRLTIDQANCRPVGGQRYQRPLLVPAPSLASPAEAASFGDGERVATAACLSYGSPSLSVFVGSPAWCWSLIQLRVSCTTQGPAQHCRHSGLSPTDGQSRSTTGYCRRPVGLRACR